MSSAVYIFVTGLPEHLKATKEQIRTYSLFTLFTTAIKMEVTAVLETNCRQCILTTPVKTKNGPLFSYNSKWKETEI